MSPAKSDDWNQHWVDYSDSAETNPAQRYRRSLIAGALEANGAARVLDIGSGQGDLAVLLSRELDEASIAGLELSQSGVDTAREKVPAVRFEQVDLLGDNALVSDLEGWATHVTCSEVLEHVDDPATLLSNGLRHAAPGARVVITVPGGPRTAFDKHIGHRRHYNVADLRQLLEASGLEVESVHGAGFPFFNLYRLVVLARGKRVIDDARSGGEDTRLGRFVFSLFRWLFRGNLNRGRAGWQLIAVGLVPASRIGGAEGSS